MSFFTREKLFNNESRNQKCIQCEEREKSHRLEIDRWSQCCSGQRLIPLMMESARGASYTVALHLDSIISWITLLLRAKADLADDGIISWITLSCWWNLREARHIQPRLSQIRSSAKSPCCSGQRLIQLMESARGASYTAAPLADSVISWITLLLRAEANSTDGICERRVIYSRASRRFHHQLNHPAAQGKGWFSFSGQRLIKLMMKSARGASYTAALLADSIISWITPCCSGQRLIQLIESARGASHTADILNHSSSFRSHTASKVGSLVSPGLLFVRNGTVSVR